MINIDKCVLTETKKKGNEIVGDYVHIYSAVQKDARAKRWVWEIVHKNLKKNIKCWEEVDEQIIKIEIEKNNHHIVIIRVYGRSYDADGQTKDEFYDKLCNLLSEIKYCRTFVC